MAEISDSIYMAGLSHSQPGQRLNGAGRVVSVLYLAIYTKKYVDRLPCCVVVRFLVSLVVAKRVRASVSS